MVWREREREKEMMIDNDEKEVYLFVHVPWNSSVVPLVHKGADFFSDDPLKSALTFPSLFSSLEDWQLTFL